MHLTTRTKTCSRLNKTAKQDREGENKVFTSFDWETLATAPYESLTHRLLIALTTYEDEHPEGYPGPCLCKTCLSYADE